MDCWISILLRSTFPSSDSSVSDSTEVASVHAGLLLIIGYRAETGIVSVSVSFLLDCPRDFGGIEFEALRGYLEPLVGSVIRVHIWAVISRDD